MSTQGPDDDDGEQPPYDCFTNVAIIGIFAPGNDEPAITEEFEVLSDGPLSRDQIWARTQLAMRHFLEALARSPRFRERFGSAPRVELIDWGSFRGC